MTVRQQLRKVHFLRSAYYFCQSWRERLRWADEHVLGDWLDQQYERADPWNYTSCPEEEHRFQSALQMLDGARGEQLFERAFEVGCAEGVFTRMLAQRCKSLVAVDISQTAMTRAKHRCAGSAIQFEQWDLRYSPAPANMDLVVIMDVLELFYRPCEIRDSRDKLVRALRPGGYLLLGNSRQSAIFEISWWGKWMLRGGKQIAEFFGRHPRLELVASEMQELYTNTLFRTKMV